MECIDKEEWESADDGSQSEIHQEDLGFITFECSRDGYLVSDAISGEEALSSLPFQSPRDDQALVQKGLHLEQSTCEEPPGGSIANNIFSLHSTAEDNIAITDSDTILVDYDDAQSEDTDKHARDDPSSVDNIYSFEGTSNLVSLAR